MPPAAHPRRSPRIGLLLVPLFLIGCRHRGFPDTPDGYREYAFVANSGTNTVSVLDLVYLRADRTLQVGQRPTALAVDPGRNEIDVVNTDSGSVSIIDGASLRVVSSIAVHRMPVAIAIDSLRHRAFVSNAGSNSISVLDLDTRREVAELSLSGTPGTLHLAPDRRTLIVSMPAAQSVALLDVAPSTDPEAHESTASQPLRLRAMFTGCPGAGDSRILPDSSKAFIACSGGHYVMALHLASEVHQTGQDTRSASDRLLAFLEVGQDPVHLALKPDGGEIFVSNAASDSITEIATETNDVGGTYMIGTHPADGIVSRDNSTLYVSTPGADSISLYSIDDGKLISSLHTGSSPGALAFSDDEHLLLAADTHSGDISIIRTQGSPNLFTILPAGSSPSSIVTMVIRAHPQL